MPRRKKSLRPNRAALGPGARVAAYLRDSGGQGQAESVPRQKSELIAYATQRHWVIVAWYTDEAKSGATDKRSDLQRLIADCRRPDPGFQAILTWNAARFGRDLLDSQFNRIQVRRLGIDVISANPAEATPDGSVGYIIEALFDWKNEQFLDDMGRDVRSGLQKNVEKGYAPGGTPPRGYVAEPVQADRLRRDGKPRIVARWVPDSELGPRVTRAFTMFAAGSSYAEIHAVTHLYNSTSGYASMVRNRTYLGVLKFGAEEFPDMIPPLVDQETWNACQTRIADGARYTPRPGREYLLSGLAECGFCGASMSGGVDRRSEQRGFRAWRYYKCGRKRRIGNEACPDQKHVNGELLEKRIISALLDRVLTPEHVQQLCAEMQERLKQPNIEDELKQIDAQIASVSRKIDNLHELAERSGTDDRLEARLAARRAELEELVARRERKSQRQEAAVAMLSPADLELVLLSLREGVASEEVAVARRAIRAFVEKVVVKGDEFRIDYRSELLLALGEVPRGLVDCARSTLFFLHGKLRESSKVV